MAGHRFLVACRADYARASMLLEPDHPLGNNKNVGAFYRKYADYEIREVDGDEMRRLMFAHPKMAKA